MAAQRVGTEVACVCLINVNREATRSGPPSGRVAPPPLLCRTRNSWIDAMREFCNQDPRRSGGGGGLNGPLIQMVWVVLDLESCDEVAKQLSYSFLSGVLPPTWFFEKSARRRVVMSRLRRDKHRFLAGHSPRCLC